MLKKIWVNNTEDKDKCFSIREEVFTREQGIPHELDIDGSDEEAYLLLLTVDDRPAATGRITACGSGYAIGRLAVLDKYRGRGLGSEAVRCLCDYIFDELGYKVCTVHAQLHAAGFYKRLGFRAVGDIFTEAGIEHITMVKEAQG